MTTKLFRAAAAALLLAGLPAGPVFAAGPVDPPHDAMMPGGMGMMHDGPMSPMSSVSPMSFGRPAAATQADRTVEIVMNDNYFEPETLKVAEGETIRFAIRNEGTLVHEFSLGTPAYHAHHQDQMTMMEAHGVLMGDHIDRSRMGVDMGGGHVMTHDQPNSVLLEPGEAGEVVWTFTGSGTGAGEIEFACNVPGHYAAGMVGTIEVE